MTSIWTATDALAADIARSPHLNTFREGMKARTTGPRHKPRVRLVVRSAAEDEGPRHGSVQELLVTYEMLQAQPLLVGMRLPHIPEFAPLHDGSQDVRRWLDVAERFAFAFVDIIEFLRSRLPGYPGLLVPELVVGAPRVRDDGFWDMRFPWMTEVRRVGLQLKAKPDMPPQALELSDGGQRLYASLGDLVAALTASATWQRFDVAHAQLSPADRDAAMDLRKEYRQAIKDECVHRIAGETAMRGQVMRRAEMETVKAKADGAVHEYFEAFDAVDELLDGVAAFITQRIARSDIPNIRVIAADWGPARDMRFMRIKAEDGEFRIPQELVLTSSAVPALSGIMLLRNINIFLDEDLLLAEGRLLSGSAAVPMSGP